MIYLYFNVEMFLLGILGIYSVLCIIPPLYSYSVYTSYIERRYIQVRLPRCFQGSIESLLNISKPKAKNQKEKREKKRKKRKSTPKKECRCNFRMTNDIANQNYVVHREDPQHPRIPRGLLFLSPNRKSSYLLACFKVALTPDFFFD